MIRVENLAKYYGGKRALGPVTFDIARGESVGFLGLNGAGKTTTLRVLACDLRPSAGSVTVADTDVVRDPHQVRKQVGFLPETPPLYPDMTVADYLAFAGKLRGMSSSAVKARLPRVCELTDIGKVKGELIGNLSHGYKQRVGVAQAVIHEPRLLILDEPTRGLDPVQIVHMRHLLRDLKQHHTVLISSHILTEVSETCDRILVLGDGAILASGSEHDLSAQIREARDVEVTVVPAPHRGDVSPVDAVLACVRAVAGVSEATGEESHGLVMVRALGENDVRASLCRALIGAGHDVIRLDRRHKQLENVFLELVGTSSRDEGSRAHAS